MGMMNMNQLFPDLLSIGELFADPDFDGTDVRNVYVNLFKDAFLEPTGDVPGLANTGAEPFAPALLALLLLLLGGAALLLGRRRRIRP